MCGPKFCSMRITQEVREYAKKNRVEPTRGIEIGLAEKAEEFQDGSGEIYS